MSDVRNITRTVLKKYVLNLNEGSKGYSGLSDEEKRNIFDNFVNTARQVHNNPNWIYDFNKFSGMSNKFEICCKTHNECWNSLPKEHLKGKYTCKSCDFWPIFINNVKKVPKYVDMGIDVSENGDILRIGSWEIKKESVREAHGRIELYCTKHKEYYRPKAMEFYKKNNPSGGCVKCNEEFKSKQLGIKPFIELYNELKQYCSASHYRKYHNKTENARVMSLLNKKFTFDNLIFDEDIIFNRDNWSEEKKQDCDKIIESIKKEFAGELQVFNDLKEIGILNIKKQESIKSPLTKKDLPFDFYLPDQKIYIEYDGQQHYEPVGHFGGIKGYERQFIRDSIKNQYIIDNNLKLIRITYQAKFKDIKEFLKKELTNKDSNGIVYFPMEPEKYNLENYYG